MEFSSLTRSFSFYAALSRCFNPIKFSSHMNCENAKDYHPAVEIERARALTKTKQVSQISRNWIIYEEHFSNEQVEIELGFSDSFHFFSCSRWCFARVQLSNAIQHRNWNLVLSCGISSERFRAHVTSHRKKKTYNFIAVVERWEMGKRDKFSSSLRALWELS